LEAVMAANRFLMLGISLALSFFATAAFADPTLYLP
jgi:hypothetical protein